MRRWSQVVPVAILLFGLGAGCGEGPSKIPVGSIDQPCVTGEGSRYLLARGFLDSAESWDCRTPRAGTGPAHFSNVDGNAVAVTGGSFLLHLAWTGVNSIQGRLIFVWVQGDRGFQIVRAQSNVNPLPAEFFVRSAAGGGNRRMSFAIDDGTGTPEEPHIGQILNVDLTLIQVGSGDIQVSLYWNTLTDMDLYLVDPTGETIFYGSRNSASGGELDLDSYAACNFSAGNGNENIYWGAGQAPPGHYSIRVNLWSACEITEDTDWRTTIVVGQTDIQVRDGVFRPDEADAKGEDGGIVIYEFDWAG